MCVSDGHPATLPQACVLPAVLPSAQSVLSDPVAVFYVPLHICISLPRAILVAVSHSLPQQGLFHLPHSRVLCRYISAQEIAITCVTT